MNKTIALLSFLCIAFTSLGQADVTSAYNANQKGDFEKAIIHIERALSNEKAVSKSKTWRYRGDIYRNVAMDSTSFAGHPDALVLANESYMKAKELDTKGSYETEIITGLDVIKQLSLNAGINMYNSGDFANAATNFALSNSIAEQFGAVDTVAVYNVALCHEKAGNIEGAIESYHKCADLGYQVPNVYLFIANLQKNNGQEDAALKTLSDARAKHPRDQGLIIEELNIYLVNGRFEEAEANLKLASEMDPTNEVLFFSLGSVYDNLKKMEQAEEAYLNSLAIKADYFDANYNLGALYFNRAVEMVNAANEIPTNQNSKYKAAVDAANAVFEQALPYLEKAHEVKPTDESTMRSLKDIYIRTDREEEYLKMKEMLGD